MRINETKVITTMNDLLERIDDMECELKKDYSSSISRSTALKKAKISSLKRDFNSKMDIVRIAYNLPKKEITTSLQKNYKQNRKDFELLYKKETI